MSSASSGSDLAARFWTEVVAPIAADCCPSAYAAGLLGPGSEVLGFDDARSTDHDWGPRLQLFLPTGSSEADLSGVRDELERRLPDSFAGHPVRYPLSHDPGARHRVEVTTAPRWFGAQVGFDPLDGVGLEQWLAVPMWRLAEVTGGLVLLAGDGGLEARRRALEWYPTDLWRWILASQWRRIAQEESFPGRCAERGDLLGASVLIGRLARDVMRLWLIAARVYPPYAKWLGTAFARLPGANPVLSDLRRALAASDRAAQERHLGAALVATARRQNELGLADPPDATLRPFHDRPFRVIGADRFAHALLAAVGDPVVRALPLTGVCDQFIDSTDALGSREVVVGATTALVGGPR